MFVARTFHSPISLRHFNDGLSGLIILLALYIFLLPFWPNISWWARHSAPLVSSPPAVSAKAAASAPIPDDNRLIIPALDLDQKIYEGTSVYTVNKGVWIRPNASTPAAGSNTVLVGHRFTYTNPRGVFYYLDKLKPGDQLLVYWQHKRYLYQVNTILAVPPTEGSVEAPTADARLTMYTCTPLWSLKERLVVVSNLVEQS